MSIIFQHVDSAYKFTNPVRKFKSNDPYYWEVDNIPIAQLEANLLWLKDQVEGGQLNISDISRDVFSELRPYVNGGDRIARVKAGRFTARINSAYDQKTLSKLVVSDSSINLGIADKFFEKEDLITQFYADLATDAITPSLAYNLNGLESVITTWAVQAEHQYKDLDATSAEYLKYTVASKLASVASVPGQSNGTVLLGTLLEATNINSALYKELSGIHSKFVLKWRAPARTAIVDVPAELTIEVDEWDDSDFSNEDKDFSNATSRIDLLFIYSHPVDASSTTIAKRTGGAQTNITKAQLGIVKGAGYTLATSLTGGFVAEDSTVGSSDIKMLASMHDQDAAANTGFLDADGNEIHGSFPSPDDLMNITPNLVAELESVFDQAQDKDGLNLIGQSVLPVAYIVVKKNTSQVTTTGKGIITSNDIIDIRPFFRTTELSYNERAGIAAATPPLSFGNPAVGKAQLDVVEKKLVENTINQIALLSKSSVWAKGTIYGGLKYGPEGTLMVLNGSSPDDYPSGEAWGQDNVLTTLNFTSPSLTSGGIRYIPDLPEWDIRSNLESGIHEVGKYINTKISAAHPHSAYKTEYYNAGPPSLASQTGITIGHDYGAAFSCLRYVSKVIQVTLPAWATDYDVNVQYENCLPQTTTGGRGEDNKSGLPIQYNGILVTKRKIVGNVATFVIICALAGKTGASRDFQEDVLALATSITDANLGTYAGFVVPFTDSDGETEFDSGTFYNKQNYFVKSGVAIVPSVSFTVTAYAKENLTFDGGSIA
jgi:hypothetical protein